MPTATPAKRRQLSPVVIVTPDFVGPIRNGGVGTATFWQARALAAAGYDVEILYSGPMQVGTAAEWESHYRTRYELRFVDLATWTRRNDPAAWKQRLFPESEALRMSYLVLQYLKTKAPAAVYFQDFCGHGFRTLQYKRAGLGFLNTPCIITLHSCHRWIREGMQSMPSGFDELMLDFQEAEAIRLADEIVAPSQYMADWVAGRLGIDRKRMRILPYCFEAGSAPTEPDRATFEGFEHLVFFGRLETRKGLHLFLEAVRKSPVLKKEIRQVTFLGKHSKVQGQTSREVIAEAMKSLPYRWEVIDNLNSVEVWQWLRDHQGILVAAPSLSDNLPYTIVELFCRRVPFVSTRVGGIPEIVGDANRHLLAPPTEQGLRDLLEQHIAAGRVTIKYGGGFDARKANHAMVEFHNAQRTGGQRRANRAAFRAGRRVLAERKTPLVSVIVPHFNSTAYLAMALETLKRQTLREPFEVIVVDDKSSDPLERARFASMAATCDDRVFRFIESPENGGPSGARNFGSGFARGRYLVFFDADNEAEPQMLEVMVRSMEATGADCLNCFDWHIPQADKAAPRWLEQANATYIYAPLGSCLEVGFLQNVFGDACAICRRTVFRALGGFTNYRGSYEDWEFFARLVMRGYKHGVIPEVLFRYRDQSEGYSRSTNLFGNRMRILQAYGSSEGRRSVDWTTVCAAITGIVCPTFSARAGSLDDTYHIFARFSEADLARYLGEKPTVTEAPAPYLEDVLTMRRRLAPLLQEWRVRCPRIFIYGTGLHTRVLLGTLPELARWVSGFIDQNPKASFLGRPCVQPDQFRADMADVVLYSSKAAEEQMYANLAHLPVKHVLIYAQEGKR